MRYVGLVDCNNFFVSCERLFRPELKRRPVVVLSSNDGCVVARSEEIKDKGIPMGVPFFQIKDTLSDMGAVTFSGNHRLYRDISQRVLYVVRSRIDYVEQYSIDEAFFSVDSSIAYQVAEDLKRQIEKEVGIPVSIGVSLNRTLAKYATGKAKKSSGVSVLSHKDWQKERCDVLLRKIWGVGGARASSFSRLGIHTVADLLSLPQGQIRKEFGLPGEELYLELSGENRHLMPVADSLPKTMMSTASLPKEIKDRLLLHEAAFLHLHDLFMGLKNKQLLAGRIRLLLLPSRYGSYAFYGTSLEEVLLSPTNDLRALNKALEGLFSRSYQSGVPYKKVGVVLGEIRSENEKNVQIFSDPNENSDISDLIYKINHNLGSNILRAGAFVKGDQGGQISPSSTLRSPSYTTKWTELPTVKT